MTAISITPSTAKTTVHWVSGTNLIVGLWLLLAPFALLYTGTTAALWNDLIIGVAVVSFALLRVVTPLRSEVIGWTNVGLGLWLLAAPWLLEYSSVAAATWNDVIVGATIIVLAGSSALASHYAARE
ncbi:MAG: hypothetical protein Kow0010_10870 [Dehalococcoidia bacterium]